MSDGLIDVLPVPAFEADALGRLVYTNQCWRKQISDVEDGWVADLVPAEDRSDFEAQWHAGVSAGGEFDLNLRRAEVDEQRWFRLSARPAMSGDLVGVLVETTELRRIGALADGVVEGVVDAIIVIDAAGSIESVNPAAERIFGYARTELVGQPVNTLMPEPHRSRHDGYLRHYIRTGEARIIGIGRELFARHKSGHTFPVYLAVSEITVDGQPRFVGIVRDLTEQREREEATREQEQRLAYFGRLSTMGEMTASIAHEINQPLTAIAMYAQSGLRMIDRPEPNLDGLKRALEKLCDQSLRAGAVIERIQRFVRKEDRQRELVDVNVLMRDLCQLADSDGRLYGIDIRLMLADDLPLVHCDPVQIQQVALNLIRNGIDAMNEIECENGRELVVTTRRSGDGVEVSVTDSGAGVDPDSAATLFTPFHTTKAQGMGMGLSICKSIMSDHGGSLNFRPGRSHGATFYFSLPGHLREGVVDG